jgi:imidazolonepropionase-like amidohydrolase
MKMAIALTAGFMAAAAAAQTPPADLNVPPGNAQHFLIVSSAGKHGESTRWVTPAGVHMGRESVLLRGQASELDSASHLGADKMLDRVAIRGFTPNGDAAETFSIAGAQATWKSPVDGATASYASPQEYLAFGGTLDVLALAMEALVAAPSRSLPLLPGGRAHAERLTTLSVGHGSTHQTVNLYSVTGISNSPMPVWFDESNQVFAFVGDLSYVLKGYEADLNALLKVQDDALAKRSPQLAHSLLKTPAGAVAFMHVRAFLDGTHFAAAQTVVIDHGVISQIGADAKVQVPSGAQVIDGSGKTLVPGLWDAHQHVPDDASGPWLLALGITSVRDPGNDNQLTLARAARRAKGDLLTPRVYPSVLIDGKGPNTAQVATVANSEAEAVAEVDKAKTDGFVGIKIYGSFNPAWVRATAAEAHRLGLHVHGHLPAGMRPADAIDQGYDEITHIYFVMMQAMPEEVVAHSNGIERFQGTGRYAKDVDLTADPMKALIAKMADRKISIDPTLVVAESLFVPENGDLSPEYAPYVGTLPPAMERGFKQGGFSVPKDLTRADFRASFAKCVALVAALHQAGVRVVAGTDGDGLELVRELELYVQAGFTPAEALASATVQTARLVGADAHVGTIAVGQDADVVLVDGDPSAHIGDLRHTRVVMMGGKLMDADALRAAAGFSGPPAASSR